MPVLFDSPYFSLSRLTQRVFLLISICIPFDLYCQDCFGDNCSLPDVTRPVFLTTPSRIAPIACDAPLPEQEDIDIMDDCSEAELIKEVLPFDANPCTGYSITYRWIAMDQCENSDTITLTFEVLPDTEKPVFDEAAPLLEDISCRDPYPDIPIIVASDNCSSRVRVDFEQEELVTSSCLSGIVIYRWIASDNCGNLDTLESQFSIIPDTEAPKIEAPLSILPISNTQMLPSPQALEVTDNCGAFPVEFDILPFEANKCTSYDVTYRWTVFDFCGNTDTVTTTFSVFPDVQAPSVIGSEWSSDIVFDPNLCLPAPIVTNVQDIGGDIIVTDDFTSLDDLTVLLTQERLLPDQCNGTSFESRTVERTYQIVDACDRSSIPIVHTINYEMSQCVPLSGYGSIAVDGETIVTAQSTCRPPPITPTESVEGQCGIVEYMWLKSEVSLPDGSGRPYPFTGGNLGSIWHAIPEALEESYHPPILATRTHYLRCARNFCCCAYTGESNGVTINIDDAEGLCFMLVEDCDNAIELVSPTDDIHDGQKAAYLSNMVIQACNTTSEESSLHLNGGLGVELQKNFSVQMSALLTVSTSGCKK